MSGVNKAIILGNVGKDPEIVTLQSGTKAASLSIATSEAWKDKATGERKEATEWHKVVFWGNLAEIVEKYVKKGDKLYIEGKIKTRSHEKDGITKYYTEIHANDLVMLTPKGQGGGQSADAERVASLAEIPPGQDDVLPF